MFGTLFIYPGSRVAARGGAVCSIAGVDLDDIDDL
jgi:hypothetical protein